MSDPAAKYVDRLDPEHANAITTIGFAAQMLLPRRRIFERLLKAEMDMHSFGCMIDPTLYRDMIGSKSFAQQLRLTRAAIRFMDEFEAVANEIDPDGAIRAGRVA